jgi:HAE1 family hydrophobic/amphiphilic exporter-1
MTALATIFALTPLALGVTGNSGFISKPLAIVVIGGLVSSTLLTLILVPVLYWLVEGRKERKVIRVNRRLVKKEARLAKKAASGENAISASEANSVASEAVLTDTLPDPEALEEVADEVVADEEPVATKETQKEQPLEQTFQPAPAATAPELAWTEEPIEVELDDESSMTWDEPKAPIDPTAAVTGLAAEMPASQDEKSAEPMTKKEIKAAKKKDKQDRKDQLRAAKNPRHSNDR